MINISKNIKTLRAEKRLTQDALAERMNVTRQTISSWETGRTQPDVGMLVRLAETLGTDAETLIYGKKNKVGLEADPALRRRTLTLTLTVMGSLFTAVGLILIFVFFWREIPDFFKHSLAFLPFLAGSAAGVAVLFKKNAGILLREGAAVLWTAGLVASGALVNAVFDARMGFANLLAADILLALPLVFLLRSVFSVSFVLISSVIEMTVLLDIPASRARMWIGLAIALFSGACCLVYRQKLEKNKSSANYEAWLLLLFALLIGILTGVFVTNYKNAHYNAGYRLMMLQILVFGLCLLLSGDEEKTGLRLRVPGALFCGIALFVNAVVFLITEGDMDFPTLDLPLSLELLICVAAIVFCGIWGRRKNLLTGPGVGLAVITALSLPLVLLTFEDLQLIMVLPSLLFGVVTVVSGVKNAKIARVNAGIVNISGVFILISAAFSESVLLLGVTALLTGLVLLLANRAMIRKFKKVPEDPVMIPETGGEEDGSHA